MKKVFTLTLCSIIAATYSFSQVKSNYEYNTSMPYGTLDIRTRISSSDYYYLQENKTFSFRESSPGVRTNTYLDMTSWDSSPYKEGNLRRTSGTLDKFIMNYRLLFPGAYSSTYPDGYPMIVHFHGAVERANCYYDNCYHATPHYTVEENSPAAPTTATSKLLNNDHNLNVGGKQYLDARNLAGTLQPDDPSMPERAFPGFVLSAQMINIWDSLQVQDVIRIARLVAEKYNIDEDRIYVQGLSIGGYSVYESMKRAPWLFAAALPMSAVWDANMFTQNQQGKVTHIPMWVFQGETDPRPTPEFTENIIQQYRDAGGIVRYTKYSKVGHVIWNYAYNTSDYFSWILKQSKASLHAFSGNTVIDKSKGIYPKLILAEGFLAYQWEKDGTILTNTANTLSVSAPGKYRARFSRSSTSPTEGQWNEWSPYVTITDSGSSAPTVSVNITSPSDGQTFTAPASVTIAATASVTEGSINKVEFYNGTTKLGEDTSSPYAYAWSSVAAGTYSVRAKAIDNAGNSAISSVSITVNPAANVAPTVNITNPADGQTFTAPASISIAATASDSDGSVTKVEFYNGTSKLGEDATSPYSFAWSNVNAGTYSLRAKAIDNSGASAISSVSITVNPADNVAPTVSITSPAGGQSFSAPASISIAASASDSDGSIAKVEFFNGTTKIGEDVSSPYSFTWSNVPAGNYALLAKAIDNSSASATDRVDVTINAVTEESCPSSGSIQAELWTGITGTSISSIPLSSSPSSVTDLTLFETPVNIGDNYGSRVRGYLCVPVTGSYTFWIASDDVSELWISTDDNPANKVKIASVSGWTGLRQWDKYSSQKSVAKSLVAGTTYYIEALLKEASGGDHLSVGWQLPGGALERPIPGHRLIKFQTASNKAPSVSFTSPDEGQTFSAPASVTLAATASDSDGTISKVEFFNGATKLGEDTSSPYSFAWQNVPAGSYSLTAKAIDNSGSSATDQVSIVVATGSEESCASTGSIAAEFWTGITGTTTSSIPTGTTPSSVMELTMFETPANIGDNYGSRVRGWICVPVSGNYTFWLASDDRSELWLSTDDNPANKLQIAYVSGWTSVRQWDKYASQKSSPISLVAGTRYYIEALLKEGTGGDHLAVGWQLPGGALERPIPGQRLIKFQSSTDVGEGCQSAGRIQVETWTGISGTRVSSIPLDTSPSSISDLALFETPVNIGDNYGSRVRGYVCVPVTGNYTFWIASDDMSELWLSTDDNPANKRQIAYVGGWTSPRQWDKYTSQRSSAISLVGGQMYYIEALLKEGTGGDHLSVGWTLPGGTLERPIPGARLSRFEDDLSSTARKAGETTTEQMLYSQISIYPNPVLSEKGLLTVSGYRGIKKTIRTQLEIINMTGELVFSESIYCGGDCTDYLVDINKQLVPGIYLITLKTNGSKTSRRLLVK